MLEIRGKVRQVDAAAQAGLTQSKISRGERGTFTLSPEDADTYARAMGATAEQRRELVALCRAAQAAAVPRTALRLVRQRTAIQRRFGELEQQSTELRSWQPDVVPGLLQTRDYTAAIVGEDDKAWWAARQARLVVLDEPGRLIHQILSEAALRWVVGSPAVMRDQLDHLADLSRRPTVRLGIVPFGQTSVTPPEGAFHLYGDRSAVVATAAGTTFVEDREDIAMFRDTFDRLDAVAVYDEAARRLLRERDL